MKTALKKHHRTAILLVLFLFIAALAITIAPGYDWINFYHPFSQAALEGRDPYTTKGVFNPPWLLVITVPFALLPEPLGGKLFSVAAAVAFFAAVLRLPAKTPETVMFFLSPLVISAINIGNIDSWVALGMTLPPQIGLFLVLLKPQVGIGIAVFWLIDSLRSGGIKQAVIIFAPVSLAFLLSVIMFGLYFLGAGDLTQLPTNISIWPWGLAVGIALLFLAVYKHRSELAMLSGFFFSPYVGIASLSIVLFSLLRDRRAAVASFLFTMILFVFMLVTSQ